MIAERNKYWDSVKGCAIISVVLGHGYAITHNFVYAYHLALFFFVSGWFYNENKYGDTPERVLAARLKTTWPKYVTYSVLLILIHYATQDFLGIDMVREKLSVGSALIYCIESSVFHLTDYLAGSMWFLPLIILAATLFGLIVWFSRRKCFGENQIVKTIVIVCLSIAFGIVGSLLSHKGIKLTDDFRLELVMKAMPIYLAAYYFRKLFTATDNKAVNLPVAVLCLGVVLLGCFLKVDMGIEANPLSFYGIGLCGIYFVLYLCKVISHIKLIQTILSIVGKYSFEIMAGNVLIYFMFNAALSRISGTVQNSFSLNYYQQYWFIQIPILLAVPCLVGVAYEKVREKLLR